MGNELIKHFFKTLGFIFIKIIGFTLLLGGIREDIIWIIIAGFLLVDLSPSFIITLWKNAWRFITLKP